MTPAARKKSMPSAMARVNAYVREQIVNGAYPPNEMIFATEVAVELGVSRTPVREAFQMLARDGWLRVYPKRGALVVPMTRADVADVFELRGILEAWSVEQLLNKPISEGTAASLQAAVKSSREALGKSDGEFRAAGGAIHRELVKATGNALLVDVFETVLTRQLRVGPTLVEPNASDEERLRIVTEHEELLEVILSGDRDTALRLLSEHLNHGRDLPRLESP